jgi:hypothetical protein
MTRAALLLALSDERDAWERWADAAWRDGYRAGYAAGYDRGYAQAVDDWKVVAEVKVGRSFAELDRLRYPPGGRLSWLIPRDGEADGGEAA